MGARAPESRPSIEIVLAWSGTTPRAAAWLVTLLAVLLNAVPALAALPVIASFTTSRTSVISGQTTTLAWSVSGATQITIDNGIGDVTSNASHSIAASPALTIRYKLTATNAEGSVTGAVKVDFIALVQLSPQLFHTEHALFIVPDPAQVTFPDWNSVYSDVNLQGYIAQLKAIFPADYMMVVVAANQLLPTKVPNVLTYRHLADGIGQNSITGVGVPNVCRYHIGTGTVIEPVFAVFDHEIGHNWGAQIGIEVGSGHWYSNTTIGGQMADVVTSDGYVTVNEIVGDAASGFQWTAVNNLVRNDTEIFADQDLYAMGLNPVFPDTYKLLNPVYNADHTMSYTSIAKYDHAWAVHKNGPRVPSYTASDKQFRLGFVYVARDIAEVQAVYANVERSIVHFENAEQVDTVRERFQVPFLVETKFRASIDAHLADLDGNARPALALAGPSYVLSTDGGATVSFVASDADGQAPNVTLVPASAYATIDGNAVTFSGLPNGSHFFTLKAQDALGKKAFAHVVVDVVTPNVFPFAARTGVAPAAVVTSNAVVLTGIGTGSPIAVIGGTYSVNGGTYTSLAGVVDPGDTVTLRVTSAPAYSTSTAATLLVGYASGTFGVSTLPPQAPRTFVSSDGDDAGPCSAPAPCRTLAQALQHTAASGEVIVVDSADYGPATILQSVSILASAGIHAAITAPSGTSALTIAAAAGDEIVLRGLSITSAGGDDGIVFASGSALHVENTTVDGFAQPGHANLAFTTATPGAKLFVVDSRFRRGSIGLHLAPTSGDARVIVERSKFESNGSGIVAAMAGEIAIRDSIVAASAADGIDLAATGGQSLASTIERTLVDSNAGTAIAVTGADPVALVVRNSTLHANGSHGIDALSAPASVIRLDRNVIAGNGVGVGSSAGGVILSRGNNTIEGNATDGSVGGSYAGR